MKKMDFEAPTLAELQAKEAAWRADHPGIKKEIYARREDASPTGTRFAPKPAGNNTLFSSTITYED